MKSLIEMAGYKGISKSILTALASVLLIFPLVPIFAQGQELHFRQLTIDDGLSQSSIFSLCQDKKGFVWIATEAGVNRFDGYNFEIYEFDPADPLSLSNNWINSVFEDSKGIIWIGTEEGLNRLNGEKETFKRFFHASDKTDTLSHNEINSIYEDRSGVLWIGTEYGLNRYNRDTQSFDRFIFQIDTPQHANFNRIRALCEDGFGFLWVGTDGGLFRLSLNDPRPEASQLFRHDPGDPGSLSSSLILALFEDHDGMLWIGTAGGGLNRLNRDRADFDHFRHRPGDPYSISDDQTNIIFEDKSGVLWFGTHEGGLNRYDRTSGRFAAFLNDPNAPGSLNSNRIYSIMEDRSGVLWIGTYGGGISLTDLFAKKFFHISHDPNDESRLSHPFVRSFLEDRAGSLWVGTDGGGLNRMDPGTSGFIHYRADPADPNSLSNDHVFYIHEDGNNFLWIGTYGGGLNRFSLKTEKFVCFRHNPDDPASLSDDRVRVIQPDQSNHILWLGTDGGGLNRFDTETGSVKRFMPDPNNPNSISHGRIFYLQIDRNGILWISTFGGGLNRFDTATEKFTRYLPDPNNPDSLKNKFLTTVCFDRQGNVWLGSLGGGLIKFDPQREVFRHFGRNEGLAGNAIFGILEDERGNLWLSTNNGLSKFHIESEVIKNYDVHDGLQSKEYNGGAFYQNQRGEMYFGGINGFNRFYPDDILDNVIKPPVVITGFSIFNMPVPIKGKNREGEYALEKSIVETDSISLSYRENSFAFEFAALHYVYPDKNEFAYMMEGFDKAWIDTNVEKRFANYTNLDPGNYIFKVKASNSDGVWNETGASIRVHISPPFWQTGWFRGLSVFLFLLLLFTFYQVKSLAIRRRNRELEEKVKGRTQELQAEIVIRKQQEREIEQRQKYLESVLYNAPDAIITVDLSRRITEWNPGADRIFGFSREEALGKQIDQLILPPDENAGGSDLMEKTLAGEVVSPRETIRVRKDGSAVILLQAGSPILIGEKVEGVVVVFTDITDRKNAENVIKASLAEKEVLLKEIHHRVKNNMQIISSLLSLQSRRVTDAAALNILKESQDRIRSMALIHERLYKSEDLANIDFSEYIQRLTQSIFSTYQANPDRISLDLRIDRIFIPVDIAVPCGLILNELLSNSIKYAFPEESFERGTIAIEMNMLESGRIRLVYSDNGIGLPEGFDLKRGRSLGFQLISILIEKQLEGSLEIDHSSGAKFKITFPVN